MLIKGQYTIGSHKYSIEKVLDETTVQLWWYRVRGMNFDYIGNMYEMVEDCHTEAEMYLGGRHDESF